MSYHLRKNISEKGNLKIKNYDLQLNIMCNHKIPNTGNDKFIGLFYLKSKFKIC